MYTIVTLIQYESACVCVCVSGVIEREREGKWEKEKLPLTHERPEAGRLLSTSLHAVS